MLDYDWDAPHERTARKGAAAAAYAVLRFMDHDAKTQVIEMCHAFATGAAEAQVRGDEEVWRIAEHIIRNAPTGTSHELDPSRTLETDAHHLALAITLAEADSRAYHGGVPTIADHIANHIANTPVPAA
jgi:hypothetical protein